MAFPRINRAGKAPPRPLPRPNRAAAPAGEAAPAPDPLGTQLAIIGLVFTAFFWEESSRRMWQMPPHGGSVSASW
jgi:hypothetical protein